MAKSVAPRTDGRRDREIGRALDEWRAFQEAREDGRGPLVHQVERLVRNPHAWIDRADRHRRAVRKHRWALALLRAGRTPSDAERRAEQLAGGDVGGRAGGEAYTAVLRLAAYLFSPEELRSADARRLAYRLARTAVPDAFKGLPLVNSAGSAQKVKDWMRGVSRERLEDLSAAMPRFLESARSPAEIEEDAARLEAALVEHGMHEAHARKLAREDPRAPWRRAVEDEAAWAPPELALADSLESVTRWFAEWSENRGHAGIRGGGNHRRFPPGIAPLTLRSQ